MQNASLAALCTRILPEDRPSPAAPKSEAPKVEAPKLSAPSLPQVPSLPKPEDLPAPQQVSSSTPPTLPTGVHDKSSSMSSPRKLRTVMWGSECRE